MSFRIKNINKVLAGLIIVVACLIIFLNFDTNINENFEITEESDSESLWTSQNVKTPESLLVYYGWPSSFNYPQNQWTPNRIIPDFGKYDNVILGAGIELASHGDHGFTKTLISNLRNTGSTKVFGYIDLGFRSKSASGSYNWYAQYTPSQLENRINGWKELGVHGIFLDNFGADYHDGHNSRDKQTLGVNAVRNAGLLLAVNAWNPDDVFGPSEDGSDSVIGQNDIYMSESFMLNENIGIDRSKTDGDYNWWTKAQKIEKYRQNVGFKVWGLTTTNNTTFNSDQMKYSYLAAVMLGYDGFGWGEKNFSASGPSNGISPFRQRPTLNSVSQLVGDVNVNNNVFTRETNNGSIEVNVETGTSRLL